MSDNAEKQKRKKFSVDMWMKLLEYVAEGEKGKIAWNDLRTYLPVYSMIVASR